MPIQISSGEPLPPVTSTRFVIDDRRRPALVRLLPSATVADQIQVKGIAFVGALRAFEAKHGKQGVQSVATRATGELGEALRAGGILANQWYAVAWYSQLLAVMLEVSGEGIDSLRGLSRDACAHDFRTLFRLARVIFSPQTIASHAVRFSQRYYTAGQIDVISMDATSVRFRCSGFRGFDRRMWTDFVGGVEGIFDAMGCSEVASTVHAGGVGDFLEATFKFAERGARLVKAE